MSNGRKVSISVIVTVSLFFISYLLAGIWWGAKTEGRIDGLQQRCEMQEEYVEKAFTEISKKLDKLDVKVDRVLSR